MNFLELLNEPDAAAAAQCAEPARQKLVTAIADIREGKFDLGLQRLQEAAETIAPLTQWLQKLST